MLAEQQQQQQQHQQQPSSWTGFILLRLRWTLRFLVITVDILLSTISHCAFLLLLKALLCRLCHREDLYWRLEGYLFRRVFGHVATWIQTAGYRVCLHGDAIPARVHTSRTLVLSNHVSTGDVPSLFYLWVASNPSPIPSLWWVMDVLFKWTPFGWVSQVHRDHFIRQGKDTRHSTIEHFVGSVARDYLQLPRRWCVVFPEGGFYRKRIAASNRFAEKNGLPALRHVTYPRAGAVYAFADALASVRGCTGLDYIIDLTIGYEDNKPFGLDDVVFGWDQPRTVHINQRVFSIDRDAVPMDSCDSLLQWMYQRWQAKDAQLDEFYRTGCYGNEVDATANTNSTNSSSTSSRHCPVEFDWPGICLSYLITAAQVYLLYKLIWLPCAIVGALI